MIRLELSVTEVDCGTPGLIGTSRLPAASLSTKMENFLGTLLLATHDSNDKKSSVFVQSLRGITGIIYCLKSARIGAWK